VNYFKFVTAVFVFFVALFAYADNSAVGVWKTIDDETGKEKSIIRIYERDGMLFGEVVDLLLKPDDTLCTKCKGELHNKPVVGMTILQNMKKDGDKYSDGTILDPEKGKTYQCKLWLEGNNLKVRGYIGFLYRTQTWLPASD